MAIMLDMPAKRHNDPKRKKVAVNFRVPTAMRDALEKLAETNGSDLSEEFRNAVRKYLVDLGLWPPPSKHK